MVRTEGLFSRRDFLKITAAGGVLATVGQVSEARAAMQGVMPDEGLCRETRRRIPLLAEADVVVVGGSSRAVAAAVAAAEKGCRVYLVCTMPYLGEDICGSHLYNMVQGEQLLTPLARRIFGTGRRPTPLEVKTALEDELIQHGVDFLYSSMPTEVLQTKDGAVAGVVIANRSGRQAIRSRAVIDATHEATVAHCIGAERTAFRSGVQEFSFTVAGNAPKEAAEILRAEPWDRPLRVKDKDIPVTQYTFGIRTEDDSFATRMDIEQRIRTALWDADQVESSDLPWYMPVRTVLCEAPVSETEYASMRDIPLDAFRVKARPGLWLLGPCAALSRPMAARAMRPAQALLLGEIIGEGVAEEAQARKMPRRVSVKPRATNGTERGELKELLAPLRPIRKTEYVDAPEGALPVLGHYEVVVMGGGTAGASAGISAARQGAKTLVLEYLHGMGGLSTLGMIGVYWDGFRGGYSATVDQGVLGMAPADHPRRPKHAGHFPADWKMEWLRRQLLNAGGQLWFGVMGCGALVEQGRVRGLIVATPEGRGVVLCDVLIDSTGSADIAIAAGAAYEYTGENLAVQGAGTGKWAPGDYYNNNDWLFVDDSDVLDISRAFVQAKAKLKGEFDMVKMPQTRERRRMVGDYAVTVYDVICQRRYADTISYHKSSFDTHGFVVDPYFLLNPPEKRHRIYDADVPLRCLLPRGLEGILVTGLGASADRDAMPVIRMQPCLQNQGYAVGYLAALCVRERTTPRRADIKKVQRHLVEIGNLPERVLTDRNFAGYTSAEFQTAASTVTDGWKGLEILLTDPAACIAAVKKEIDRQTDAKKRLVLASILCMLGDATHAELLAEAIRSHKKWDAGWHYTGMGQFGSCLSPLDALIMSLGRSARPDTLPAILDKARLLRPENTFSHYRSVSEAAAHIGSPAAAETLAAMLNAPGISPHAMQTYAEARRAVVPGHDDTSTRNLALKELHLARALFRCGDLDGQARQILERYAHGLQAHYARYAFRTLAKG